MRSLAGLFAVSAVFALSNAVNATPISETYTLYRNSVLDASMRLHVATFDAVDGGAYNRENCIQARALFQGQPSVKTKFWCEHGRFHGNANVQQSKLSSQFTTGKGAEITCSASASELIKPVGNRRQGVDRCPR